MARSRPFVIIIVFKMRAMIAVWSGWREGGMYARETATVYVQCSPAARFLGESDRHLSINETRKQMGNIPRGGKE